MTHYIDVAVAAINLSSDLDQDDLHVPGIYSVLVQKGLPEPKMASVALDVFHSCCAISVLDDFAFFVLDPRTGKVLVEDDDHEAYSGTHLGQDCIRIADIPNGVKELTPETLRLAIELEQSRLS